MRTGLQFATCCSASRGIGQLPTGPRYDLSRHAGQSPPTIPQDPHPWADGSPPVDEPKHAIWSLGYLLIWCRADYPRVGD